MVEEKEEINPTYIAECYLFFFTTQTAQRAWTLIIKSKTAWN